MTPTEIVARLRALSGEMITLGTAMDYFGGFDGRMVSNGRDLVGAGLIAHEWAEQIEQEVGAGKTAALKALGPMNDTLADGGRY